MQHFQAANPRLIHSSLAAEVFENNCYQKKNLLYVKFIILSSLQRSYFISYLTLSQCEKIKCKKKLKVACSGVLLNCSELCKCDLWLLTVNHIESHILFVQNVSSFKEAKEYFKVYWFYCEWRKIVWLPSSNLSASIGRTETYHTTNPEPDVQYKYCNP